MGLGSGGTFIARSIDTESKHLSGIVKRGSEHNGTAFIEILQNCPIYNDGVFDQVKDKKLAPDFRVEVRHGEPITFGKENEKGIKLNRETLALEVVPCLGNESEVLVHDELNKVQAQLLSEMKGPNFPIAVGVLYKEEKSSFVADVYEKLDDSNAEPASLQALLESGHTWQAK